MRASYALFSILPAISGAMAAVCKPSSSASIPAGNLIAVDSSAPPSNGATTSVPSPSVPPGVTGSLTSSLLPGGVSASSASQPVAVDGSATSLASAATSLPPTGTADAVTATAEASTMWLDSGYVKVMPSGAQDTGVPAPTLSLNDAGKDNECGYNVASLESTGHQYFRKRFSFDFSSLPDGQFSGTDDLYDQGWTLRGPEAHVGGPYLNETTGITNQCLGDPTSLSIVNGELHLTMRGGQPDSPNMQCPEIIYNEPAVHGVFQASMQLTDDESTCQAFWLNHTAVDTADELDIEVIGKGIYQANEKGTGPGLWSTSWEPTADPSKPDDIPHTHGLAPFPAGSSPTEQFNNYTIAWLPDSQQRYFNGIPMASAIQYNAVNAMNPSINNWSNGAPGWSGAVPKTDSVMKVKNVIFYYNTESDKDLPANCQQSDVITV